MWPFRFIPPVDLDLISVTAQYIGYIRPSVGHYTTILTLEMWADAQVDTWYDVCTKHRFLVKARDHPVGFNLYVLFRTWRKAMVHVQCLLLPENKR